MTRDEIIKGLNVCIADAPDRCWEDGDYPACPYNSHVDGCQLRMMMDVAELLKAEAPRVLTLEELMGFDGAFLIEYNISFVSLDPIWAMFHYMDKKWVFIYKGVVISHYSVEQYGRTWRCWSRRPTDEQMEAKPWR